MVRCWSFLLLLLGLGSLDLKAQDSNPGNFYQLTTAHYSIADANGPSIAADLGKYLEALLENFTRQFRFDAGSLKYKLKVRSFATKDAFDAYLKSYAKDNYDDFVYVSYQDPSKSELVLFKKPEPAYQTSLGRQVAIQALMSFINNPPIWLRDGLAAYYETFTLDFSSGKVNFPEALVWLAAAKKAKTDNTFIPLNKLFTISIDESKTKAATYYPEAWAFLSFLISNSNRTYARMLSDIFAALKPAASLEDNQSAGAKLLTSWYPLEDTTKAFYAYLDSKKSFDELVEQGVSQYNASNFEAAIATLKDAASLEATSPVPDYYTGLSQYGLKQYDPAIVSLNKALEKGSDAGLTNYALGIIAVAKGDQKAATDYLNKAKTAAPDKYGTKVDELLSRLSS